MLVLWKGIFHQVFSLEKSSMPIREGCLSFRTRLLTTEKLPRRHAYLERMPLVSTGAPHQREAAMHIWKGRLSEAPHQRKATVPIWQGGCFSPSKVLDHGFLHTTAPHQRAVTMHIWKGSLFYNPERRQSS